MHIGRLQLNYFSFRADNWFAHLAFLHFWWYCFGFKFRFLFRFLFNTQLNSINYYFPTKLIYLERIQSNPSANEHWLSRTNRYNFKVTSWLADARQGWKGWWIIKWSFIASQNLNINCFNCISWVRPQTNNDTGKPGTWVIVC